ncbi:MAG: 3'-5' exoribonuclease, partial [Cyanobacteria bacterium J06638_20]
MLDLETWSTRPTAAVAQIALVPFEFRARGRVYNESVFNKFVLLQDGMGALDQGTLSFWLGQGDKARSMLVQGLQNDGVPLLDALTSLMTWPAET